MCPVLRSITEDTITVNVLEDELKQRGVRCQPFERWKTSIGVVKPDLFIWNGGKYIVESKFKKREYIKAVTKIYDSYIKISDELELSGGFAVLYPEQLTDIIRLIPDLEKAHSKVRRLKYNALAVFSPNDQRNVEQFEGTISELADWITTRISQTSKTVEPDIQFIIEVLRQGSLRLKAALEGVSKASLLEMFGGKNVFENILQYDEKKYPTHEMMHAAAYILIDQIVFYHILSKYNSNLQELDENKIEYPQDLSDLYFKKVLDNINYSIVFNYTVAPKIPRENLEDLKSIIKVVKAISPEKVQHDVLGTIFHDLIPLEVRKKVAAYYTNILAAELLASLAIKRSSAKVADFASGSGGLLSAAYRLKRALLDHSPSILDHKKFVENDLLGIDVMAFASHLTAINLSLQAPKYITNKVNVAIWDSTFLEPDITIKSIAELSEIYRRFARTFTQDGESFTLQSTMDSYYVSERGESESKAGPIALEGVGEKITLRRYDTIMMNPPFTRQERIPNEYKNILEIRFSSYSNYYSGRMGYYGWFLLLSDKFLEENGRIALVIPATLLRVQSNIGLRKLLSEKYTIEHVIVTWYRSAFSESTRFREMLLVARRGIANEEKVSITFLKRLPSTLQDARDMSKDILSSSIDVFENDDFLIRRIENSKFKSNIDNWFVHVAFYDTRLANLYENLKSSNILITRRLEVTRFDMDKTKWRDFHGYILYEHSRALKKGDVWIVDEVLTDTIKVRHRLLPYIFTIPIQSLMRGLRRQSYVKSIDVTYSSDYMVKKPFNSLREIIKHTPESIEGWNDDQLLQWQEVFSRKKSKLVISRRFDISAKGTCCLSNFSEEDIVASGTMWHVKGIHNTEYLKIMALWFNSTLNILQILAIRRETRGAWIVLDDYMFDQGIIMPNLEALTEQQKRGLLELYDEFKNFELDSILDQLQDKNEIRERLDKAFLDLLGYAESEVESLFEWIYDALAKEIKILKKLMGEGIEQEQEERLIDEYV